jgi:hypothetical protein
MKNKNQSINYATLVFEESNAAETTINNIEECNSSINLWHARLGHQNQKMILKLRNVVDGMDITSDNYDVFCEVCNTSKFPSTPYIKSKSTTSKPLELIHSDVTGPFRITAFGGYRFVVSFIDDYSRYQRTYLMRYKSEVLDKFKEFLNSVGKYSKDQYKILRSDNGSEYKNTEFKNFCLNNKIKQEFTNAHSPQQNGVAERNWRSLM